MTTQQGLHMVLIGSGGDGVMATASMILKTASKMGFYGVMTQSYGPQIRGGEAAAHVSIGTAPTGMVDSQKDLVVCFRFSDALRFAKEFCVAPHAAVLHGKEESAVPDLLCAKKGWTVAIPFQEILEKEGFPEITKNVFVFGMLLKILGWDLQNGIHCVEEIFAHKSTAVVATNLKAMETGYRYLDAVPLPFKAPKPVEKGRREVLSGNEACARAAVEAGCRFYAGYPITPSSEILETMNDLLPSVGGHLIQGEDEIASLGMVIGASYGGIPSMTATSGPGFSLMTEMLGLASMAEIPVVVIDCQRAGPSTGIPSRTEQSDLWHAIYGGHGDFPRVVLAPLDVKDCFQTVHRAFHLSESFQLPVIVLSDAAIGQATEVIDPVSAAAFPKPARALALPPLNGYQRFSLQALQEGIGVNAVALPGTEGGMHSIAGIEHTEAGVPCSDGDHHEKMNQKRFQKMEAIALETGSWYSCHGPSSAPHALIAWGSSSAVAKQYVALHPDTALFLPEILHPFPVEGLRRFLEERKTITLLEMNHQGQLYHYLRGCGVLDSRAKSARRSGGLAFRIEELTQTLRKEAAS